MLTKMTTMIHPSTGDTIISKETIQSVELDSKHLAYRMDDRRYCVACFVHGIGDVSIESYRSRGTEYVNCYACKAQLEFKEVE